MGGWVCACTWTCVCTHMSAWAHVPESIRMSKEDFQESVVSTMSSREHQIQGRGDQETQEKVCEHGRNEGLRWLSPSDVSGFG